MKAQKLPQTDSIEELARFWDTHDLTDFEDELEEVTEPVFVRKPEIAMVLHLEPPEVAAVDRLAREKGVGQVELVREWVLEKLQGIGAR